MFEIKGKYTGKLFGRTETYLAACAMAALYFQKYCEPMRIVKR